MSDHSAPRLGGGQRPAAFRHHVSHNPDGIGWLKLDDEIQLYVPEFPKEQSPVTLRQTMGHTVGIVSDGGEEGALFSKHCERPSEALRDFADRALHFEPGTRYDFSTYDWILATAAIENAAEQRSSRS